MKTLTTDRGLFIDFTAEDVAGILEDFYCDEKESEIIFNACVLHFERCTISTRQQLIKTLIKKHFSKKAAAEMVALTDSFDTNLFT